MTKLIPLSLSESYVSAWGTWEAIREILQNAIDEPEHTIQFMESEGKIIVTNSGVIPTASLLLGNSSKQGDSETIGQFGEGFKLALLVLARQGKKVTIINDGDLWEPVFEYSDLFEDKCLHIRVTPGSSSTGSVAVSIEYLTFEEFTEIGNKYLTPDRMDVVFEGSGSQAFTKGKVAQLFVKGLYVCDLDTDKDKYTYSYNMAPNMIQLDRDRNKVSTWAIQSDIVDMVIASGRMDLLQQMASGNKPDVRGFSSWKAHYYGGSCGGQTYSSVLNQRITDSLVQEHGPNVFIINADFSAKKIHALSQLAANAKRNIAIVNNSMYEMVAAKSPLKSLEHEIVKGVTPDSILDLLNANKKHMRSKPYRQLKKAAESLLYSEYLN